MTRPRQDSSDDALKQALRALPAASPADELAALDALGTRVLAQWQARHATGAAALPGAKTGQRRRWRHRWWVGSAGLAAAVALATALLVDRPDPALDELMQPDVLSQIAIGEM